MPRSICGPRRYTELKLGHAFGIPGGRYEFQHRFKALSYMFWPKGGYFCLNWFCTIVYRSLLFEKSIGIIFLPEPLLRFPYQAADSNMLGSLPKRVVTFRVMGTFDTSRPWHASPSTKLLARVMHRQRFRFLQSSQERAVGVDQHFRLKIDSLHVWRYQ